MRYGIHALAVSDWRVELFGDPGAGDRSAEVRRIIRPIPIPKASRAALPHLQKVACEIRALITLKWATLWSSIRLGRDSCYLLTYLLSNGPLVDRKPSKLRAGW
jgi:hypothetical protein